MGTMVSASFDVCQLYKLVLTNCERFTCPLTKNTSSENISDSAGLQYISTYTVLLIGYSKYILKG